MMQYIKCLQGYQNSNIDFFLIKIAKQIKLKLKHIHIFRL